MNKLILGIIALALLHVGGALRRFLTDAVNHAWLLTEARFQLTMAGPN